MPLWLNKANIYLFAWCVYSSQGIFFPKGTLFTQLLVIVLLTISFYYVFVANTRYKLPLYFWGLNLLLSLFIVYGVYLMIGGYNSFDYALPVDSFNYLKVILISLIPIYPFYVFSKECLITEKYLVVCFFILFGLTIANYYEQENELLIKAMLLGNDAEEFTNNVGYVFLSLMPICVFLYKRPILQYIALGACLLFIFMSMKRGAIAIGTLCFVLFICENLKNASFKRKVGILSLSTVLCFIGYQYIENKIQESLYFQKRITDTLQGNSSGRDKLYNQSANFFWNDASAIQFLFGAGANGTLKVSDDYAHNDWLEIAVNQGVLGLIFFVIYWFLFAKTVFFGKYERNEKAILQFILMIYFLRTFFSMSYGAMGYIPMLSLGYCLASKKE